MRSRAGPSTKTRPTGASTPSRTRARVCGPSVRLLGGSAAADPITATADALAGGAIVAIKGIGGYHLACFAADERAVATLRARKHREDKPFALMAPSPAVAESLDLARSASSRAADRPGRPIVLAPRRPDAPVAESVAPGAPELGVMLPYSPLHHLLLHDVGETLVMTSGNVSDEPIAYRDDDALERLRGIADLFLVHDRPIQTRTDDSVVRARTILRRSRGYVPAALSLPGAGTPRPLLACGAELKNTFCLARGTRAWVSHHIGDLENYETLRSFTEGIEHFGRLFAVEPEVVAHDLHPEYLSTKYALERDGVELVGVQHHHAHLAACLAEHGETDPAHRPSARSSTAPGTASTEPCGAASCCSATCARSVAWARYCRLRSPAARARSSSRGGWRAPGCPALSTAPNRICPRRSPGTSILAPGCRCTGWRSRARPRRRRPAWGACSTRSARSPASARRSTTRARPRSSSKPRATRTRAARIRSRSAAHPS